MQGTFPLLDAANLGTRIQTVLKLKKSRDTKQYPLQVYVNFLISKFETEERDESNTAERMANSKKEEERKRGHSCSSVSPTGRRFETYDCSSSEIITKQ